MIARKEDKIILVTGATGHQGGAVVRSLKVAGWPLRALVRNPQKTASRALKDIGVEIVQGDLEERAAVDKAVKGVYGVFSVQTWREKGAENEVRMGKNLVDAAKVAGVRHFIYSSVGGADRRTRIPHFESKFEIEEHVRASGLPATIFRPVYFMYNFSSPELHAAILGGSLPMALRPDRRMQMLAVEDLGEFVRLAFENPENYLGRTIELAGDEVTMPDAADVFSRVIDKPVRYVQQPIEDIRRFNKDVARMYEWFNEHGYRADIPALRVLHPRLMTLELWLKKTKWAKAA